ncbi:hypothetical protein [Aquincola tertiaricarbonis]|uniref:hypothetical protein n=1 Tax=Aquincola tertiaricarbonis TaxID=391953 RepID=UPI0012ED83F1|nr:hypothetical protein [Aquincola tertiaricarbonis]
MDGLKRMAMVSGLAWAALHGSVLGAPGGPRPSVAASAASAATPAPSYEERVRRCQAHPVRAVREECLRQVRKDFGRT